MHALVGTAFQHFLCRLGDTPPSQELTTLLAGNKKDLNALAGGVHTTGDPRDGPGEMSLEPWVVICLYLFSVCLFSTHSTPLLYTHHVFMHTRLKEFTSKYHFVLKHGVSSP